MVQMVKMFLVRPIHRLFLPFLKLELCWWCWK